MLYNSSSDTLVMQEIAYSVLLFKSINIIDLQELKFQNNLTRLVFVATVT